MLLPFEAMGVDTSWELQMPKAANAFDYRTLAEVLVTIEYTALHDADHRQRVIRSLSDRLSTELSFSPRDRFPDAWYDLINAELPEEEDEGEPADRVLPFAITGEDFPPNAVPQNIEQVSCYILRSGGSRNDEVDGIALNFTPVGGQQVSSGQPAGTAGGVISTRRGQWTELVGGSRPPIGTWKLTVPGGSVALDRLMGGKIEDILVAITYEALTPAWVA